MLPTEAKRMRGRGPLGWIIAVLLAGAVFALLIHVPDDGPHVFQTLPTTSTSTTFPIASSTTVTTIAGVPTTTTTIDGSTSTTTVGATSTTAAGPPVADNPLVGNTFLVQSASLNGDDYPVTSRITLTFSQDGNQQTAYWDNGCNAASAPVVIRAATISVGTVASGSAGCSAEQPADTFFLTPLMKANPKWSKDGSTVVFEGAGRRVVTAAL